jgi:hypothetical protein
MRRCTLADLQPDTGYEVRVSYPGTIPATVHVAFSARARAQGGATRCAVSRGTAAVQASREQ